MKPELGCDHSSGSGFCRFRSRVVDLERKLREEKESSALFQSESELKWVDACQQVGRYRRECLTLQENVTRLAEGCDKHKENAKRLEEECCILRKRETRDRKRIQGLLEEIVRKDEKLKAKVVEFTVENRDLEFAKRRALDEVDTWKMMYEESHASESRIFNEILRLKNGKGKNPSNCVVVDSISEDEGQGSNADCFDEEGGTPLTQVGKKAKKIAEVVDEAGHAGMLVPPNGTLQVINRRLQLVGSTKSVKKRRACTGQVASPEQELSPLRRAEMLRSNLNSNSNHPSFLKIVVRSNISALFWLCVPKHFCKDHLPAQGMTTFIVLEDENVDYEAIYFCERFGIRLPKGLVLAHNLEVGDCMVFELSAPARFKYMYKMVFGVQYEDHLHKNSHQIH